MYVPFHNFICSLQTINIPTRVIWMRTFAECFSTPPIIPIRIKCFISGLIDVYTTNKTAPSVNGDSPPIFSSYRASNGWIFRADHTPFLKRCIWTGMSVSALMLFVIWMLYKGGVISGDNPARYNPSDPIRLWIIQVGTLSEPFVMFSRFLIPSSYYNHYNPAIVPWPFSHSTAACYCRGHRWCYTWSDRHGSHPTLQGLYISRC